MDKYLVLEDGTRYKLSAITWEDWKKFDNNVWTPALTENSYHWYLKKNDLHTHETLQATIGIDELAKAIVEVYDGEHHLRWNTDEHEWQVDQGFPQDDAFSIMHGDTGCGNLDIYYATQFVQNETVMPWVEKNPDGDHFYSVLERSPVLAGTLVGTVYHKDIAVQTFQMSDAGVSYFKFLGNPVIYATDITLNCASSEIKLTWNTKHTDDSYLIVSYEYDFDLPEPCKYKPYKKPKKNEVTIE